MTRSVIQCQNSNSARLGSFIYIYTDSGHTLTLSLYEDLYYQLTERTVDMILVRGRVGGDTVLILLI